MADFGMKKRMDRARAGCVRLAMLGLLFALALGQTAPPASAFAQEPAAESPKSKPKTPAKAGEPAEKPASKPAEPQPSTKKFYEQERYDVITLDKANDNVQLKVMPLPFPNQRMPEPKPAGKLKVRLFDKRNEEYEVLWRHIEKIEFFPDFVLLETDKIVAEAAELSLADKFKEAQLQFDEAYDYYQFLRSQYPKTRRLQESLQTYLYLNALSLFKRDRIAEAFAILEELYSRNNAYKYRSGTVKSALDHVGKRLIGGYVEQEDYVSARMLLERLDKDYGNRLSVAATCRKDLMDVATGLKNEAAGHLAAKRFRQAHDTSREMMKVWPGIEGGRELILEIARVYPLVVVGVSMPAFEDDPASLDNTAARRAGSLLHQTLLRYTERGPEGGRYACPYGMVQPSDDRTELIFDLRDEDTGGQFTGYDLSRHLLSLADPAGKNYQPSWASLMADLKMENVNRVRIKLRRPHVLPQALLQSRLTVGSDSSSRYSMVSQSESETRFEPANSNPNSDELKPVLVERFYPAPREAIRALRKGKIDIIDRVLPTDAMRLKEDSSLEIGTYGLPSIHVLVPNTEKPFLGNRTFRRALVYGINRGVILNKGLLNGAEIDGCRVLSVPFPAGVTENDPSAYAYDDRIPPRPYDPVMAAILVQLAVQQLAAAADMREEPAPELGELVIAHPPFELPQFVCKQIQAQLDAVEIKCSLRELPPGRTNDPNGEYDLLYLELSVREPLVDVPRIFGAGGTAPSTDPYVGLALRQLEEAENWKEIRGRLHELHRLIHEEVTVIPLWQMTDYFVYHRGLRGMRDRPIFFYQDVDKWRVVPPVLKD